jgi:NAD+ kinase
MDHQKKTIILYPNAERDIDFAITRRVNEILERHGRRTAFCPVFDDDTTIGAIPQGFKTAILEDELQYAEMIITFGGDGTILRAARAAAGPGVPILGINLGGKGFMAELEIDDIGLIDQAAIGDYRIGSRMMLDVGIQRDGETVCRDFALNDVVIRGDNKVIDLTLFGEGQRISHFSGDGAVIATPTGSTAYSMAAGGPIVEPTAHNIIVTPICAHVLEAKSFVLVSDRRVSVEIGYKKHNPAYMSVDGGDHVNIRSGDIVNVHKSERETRFVRLSDRSFYRKVSEKLGEKP